MKTSLFGLLCVVFISLTMAQKFFTEFTLTETSSDNHDTLKQQVLTELQNLNTEIQHHIDNITITSI